MNWRKNIIYVLLSVSLPALCQPPGGKADTATVNKLLQQSKDLLKDDPAKAISVAIQARDMSDDIHFTLGKAKAQKNAGLGYYYQGKYMETLDFWNKSLKNFEELQDDNGVANLLNNIAAVYSDQGDQVKALEYSLRSLKLSEKTGDKLRRLSALNTIGSIYSNKKDWDKALDYLLMALPLCKEIGDNDSYGVISENIGELYIDKGTDLPDTSADKKKFDAKALSYFEESIKALDSSANVAFAYNGIGKLYLRQDNPAKALEYHQKALAIAEKLNSKLHIFQSLEALGNVYMKKKDYATALSYYSRAITGAEELRAVSDLKDLYQQTSIAYSKINDYKNAFKYRSQYADIKDTIYNIETNKKLGAIQFESDLEKKQGEINLLTKDKSLKESQLKRQKFAKNAFMIGLALVGFIALLAFWNYRNKARTHKVVDKQKKEIEHLLLNILPQEVAQELQQKGFATPRYYESVSVMFTDFKSFTLIADEMEPGALVEELNACFIAFDNIIGKNKIEKIKTIGDSYMCAGGIPTPDPQHVYNMVKASMEIQQYIIDSNKVREQNGHQPWNIRIGIHVGPVVAGVVGKTKYAYDIWGSTVNIASRMESNGEPQRVNISAATYELIRDKYSCTYRGKISAKNIGEIDMYFVDHEIEETIELHDSSHVVMNAG